MPFYFRVSFRSRKRHVSKLAVAKFNVTFFFLSAPYRRKSTCAVWPVSMNSPPGTNFLITWRPRATPLPSPPITLLKRTRKRRTPGRTDNREANRKTEGCSSECTFVQENKTSAAFLQLDMQLCNHQEACVFLSLEEWICAPWADI